jgi:hypothetical protein
MLSVDAVLICAQAGLALVFIAAGVGKLLDRVGSIRALRAFGVPLRWARPGARVLPVVELATAAALLIQPLAVVGAALALVLLAAFSAGILRALRKGLTPDCHCFGQLHSAPAGHGTVLRNAALAVPASLVAVAGPSDALKGIGADGAALVTLVTLVAALTVATIALLRENRILREGGPAGPQPLEIGDPVPALELRDPQGASLAIHDLVDAERPTVLVYVQPGCGPCKTLMPKLERWRPVLAERVKLLVVSGPPSSGEEPTPNDLEAAPQTFWDMESAALARYRLPGTPAAMIIDPGPAIGSAPATGVDAVEALIRVAQRRRRAWQPQAA